MAKVVGDVKPTVGRGRGSWGGSQRYYDDGGRGTSKSAWERFKEAWDVAPDKKLFLFGLTDHDCYDYLRTGCRYLPGNLLELHIPQPHITKIDTQKITPVLAAENPGAGTILHFHCLDNHDHNYFQTSKFYEESGHGF